MASYNKVILMGHLTRDPQNGQLPSGTPVCEFGLAVNRQWKDAQGGAKEEVLFIDCTAFNKVGQAIGTHLTKGRAIHVEGHLKLDTWEGQGGRQTQQDSRYRGAVPVRGRQGPDRHARRGDRTGTENCQRPRERQGQDREGQGNEDSRRSGCRFRRSRQGGHPVLRNTIGGWRIAARTGRPPAFGVFRTFVV